MKLSKALKLRKNLTGEISKIKQQIESNNSYLEGSTNSEKFNVEASYNELLSKIDELTSLKFIINEANRDIQARIYVLGEYKALIAFWNGVSVVEGAQLGGGFNANVQNYLTQFDGKKRDDLVKHFQKRVDAIQEELDVFNFTTDIPWGEITLQEQEDMSNVKVTIINGEESSNWNDEEDMSNTKWNVIPLDK